MFGFLEESHQTVYGDQHEGKFSHEIVAGGAAFAATKMFEDRQRREGKPVSHAFAKEALAGFAGAEVDKLFETKGLDYLDQREARGQAEQYARENYDNHYGGQEQWHPDQPPQFDYQSERYNRY